MAIYILQVSISWIVFLLLYFVLFRKETFFQLNRWYLLTTFIAGLLVPLIQYISVTQLFGSSPAVEYVYYLNQGFDQFEVTVSAAAKKTSFNFTSFLLVLYTVGVCLLMVRFLFGLARIFRIYKNGTTSSFHQYELIQSPQVKTPFSFLNKIFIPTQMDATNQATQKILAHEKSHCEEWHSVDVLLFEILNILFWFNPLLYIYKNELKNIHEYIADEYVLTFSDAQTYGHLLLQNISPISNSFLENQFYNSQIKNRIIMMTKMKSSRNAIIKYAMLIPIFLGLLITFSACESGNIEEPMVQNEQDIYKVVDEMPHFPGCEMESKEAKKDCWQSEMLQFIYKGIRYPKAAKEAGIEGTCVFSFIVEKDGTITNIESKRPIGGGLEEECIRGIKQMPRWVAGKKDGIPVRVEFTLPIKFKLE